METEHYGALAQDPVGSTAKPEANREAVTDLSPGACRIYREAVAELSPGACRICSGAERWLIRLIRKAVALWTGSLSSAARKNSLKGQRRASEELAHQLTNNWERGVRLIETRCERL